MVPVLWESKEECCGCTLCAFMCPTSAIIMKPDEKGFLYPYINDNICIECKKCVRSCVFKIS